MSINAVSWALGLPVGRSSTKFVLVALCNYANEFGECYPSAKQLSDDTCQDIKTVESNLARLRDCGLIVDTGDRRGATKQVIVYRIVPSAVVQKPVETPPKTDELNTPVFPGNTPVFPEKHPQKRGTEPSRNHQGTVRKEVKRATATTFVLPDWINKTHWDAWHSCAKRKNATDAQKQMAVNKLADWRQQGIDYAAALENAAIAGWQGLFKPDVPAAAMMPGRNRPTGETAYQRSMRERIEEAAPEIARRAPAAPPQDAADFFRTVDAQSRVVDVKAIEVTP